MSATTEIKNTERQINEYLNLLSKDRQQQLLLFAEFLLSQQQQKFKKTWAEDISVYDAAKEYAGCLEGEGDALAQKKAMKSQQFA